MNNKFITFDCEYCNEPKTERLSAYNNSKTHFCSIVCFGKSRQKDLSNIKINKHCHKCNKEMTDKDKKITVSYRCSKHCKSCREIIYSSELLKKKLKQQEFIKKFNKKMIWSK